MVPMVQTELYSCKVLVLCQLVCFLEEGYSGDRTLLSQSVNTVKTCFVFIVFSLVGAVGLLN